MLWRELLQLKLCREVFMEKSLPSLLAYMQDVLVLYDSKGADAMTVDDCGEISSLCDLSCLSMSRICW